MKLWHISQTENRGYDTYDSAVVTAETENDARRRHPNGKDVFRDGKWWRRAGEEVRYRDWDMGDWVVPTETSVLVQLIGEAVEGTKAGVVCASYNAG